MAIRDMQSEALPSYRYDQREPDDFDQFWAATLEKQQAFPLDARLSDGPLKLDTVEVHDLRFAGYDGHEIAGWFMRPRHATGPLPLVVEYVPYGGGRGLPTEWLHFSAAGFAHLVMDTRGQGSVWRAGDTSDPVGSEPAAPGYLTRGILSRETFYYRRYLIDAIRAVAVGRTLDGVDPSRVAVTGRSQGGAAALAAAAFAPGVSAAFFQVPFLCAVRRASRITDDVLYAELARWCAVHRDKVELAFKTISYFDGVHLAARAKAPGWFTAGLMDAVCPPSTVYAAYNAYAAEKSIRLWEFNGHEGGGPQDIVDVIHTLQHLFGATNHANRKD